MNEMVRVRLMVAVLAVVMITASLFFVMAESFDLWSVVVLVTVVAIALVALVLVVRTLREVRSGLPLQDERSKAMGNRAGYYAFYVSVYFVLGLGAAFVILEEHDIEISNSLLLFILVMIMGTSHMAISAYLGWKDRRSSA